MNIVQIRKLDYQILCFFLCLSYCLTFPGSAHALFGGKIDKFTADQVELSSDGKILNTLKLYVTPNAVRMDGLPGAGMNPNMPKMDLSVFTFKDKDEHYIFNHSKKLYYKTTMGQDDFDAALKDYKDAEHVKILGKEKVSGYKCEKKEITSSTTIFGISQTSKMIIWESDRFEIPLRTQSPDGHMSEIRNIDKGSPAKNVFRLPKGYKKVDNIMMAMGMDFKSMGNDSGDQPVQPGTPSGKEDKPFKMPEINKDTIEKSIQGLGDKLKNFKFGD